MPLPISPLTLHGGCNCRAIRYKIDIPAQTSRPLHPNYKPTSTSTNSPNTPAPPIHLPYTFTDHCNDCRRATGSALPMWICPHISQVCVSVVPRDADVNVLEERARGDEGRSYVPAEDVVIGPGPKTALSSREEPGSNSLLKFYESSPGVHRGFCGRCGVMLSFWDEKMPGLMDLQLGTLDREGLEEWGEPERHLHWGSGVGWIKRMVREGDGDGGGDGRRDGRARPVRHEGSDFNVCLGEGEG